MATTGFYLNQFVTKNLSGAVGDTTSTTGITLDSVTGIDTTKPGIAALTWADPLDEDSVEWISYTSIDGSNEFAGVVRGAEGGTPRTHLSNAVVAFPISESHINNLATGLSIGGVATNLCEGVLDENDMASDSATKVPTQQSVKAYCDTNKGVLTSGTDGATITFNMDTSKLHTVTLGGNRTLAVSNADAGQAFVIRLVQDGTGSRTVTWFSTIKWAGGSAPTLTTTASKTDAFGFICTSSGNYDGYIIGQNL